MRAFLLPVERFPDVVQKARALCQFHIRAELSGQDTGKIGNVDGMLQDILSVARAIFEAPQNFDELRMHAAHAASEDRLLAGFANGPLHFFRRLGDDLFNPRRVNTTVSNQIFQRQPRNFTPHRIERRQDDGFRRVVDDKIHARQRLDGANVSSLATDNPPLHFIIGQGNDRHRRLGNGIRRIPLHGAGQNLPRRRIRIFFDFRFVFPNPHRLLVRKLFIQAGQQQILGVIRGKSRDFLQFLFLLRIQIIRTRQLRFQGFIPIGELFFLLLRRIGAPIQMFFLLHQTLLVFRQFFAPFPILLLHFVAQLVNLLARQAHRLFFEARRFFLRPADQLFRIQRNLLRLLLGRSDFRLRDMLAQNISHTATDCECHDENETAEQHRFIRIQNLHLSSPL